MTVNKEEGPDAPAFHPEASFFGYAGERLVVGTVFLFNWIDSNGPAPDIRFHDVHAYDARFNRRFSARSGKLIGKLAASVVHMQRVIKSSEGFAPRSNPGECLPGDTP
jgi:hypothetical protein